MNPTNDIVAAEPAADKHSQAPLVYPPVDVYENEDEFLLVADLPGVDPSALSIELEESNLHVEGWQNPDWTGAMQAVRFERSFRIPDLIADDGVSAELRSGVLEIHLRKRETAKPRRITVSAQ
jgi:HSP20 family protein